MKALWLVLGTYTTVWGLWLLSPFWEVFTPQAGLYGEMASFMPEWAWGLHALVIGVCTVYGIAYHWPRGLWWGRIAASYHWVLIAFFYVLGDWRNTGWITSLCIVVAIQFMWKYTERTPVVHPLDSDV